ncbi:MAG TPA: hypothetical protein VGI40_13880 [Pirellulaceae bacterium]
MLTRQRFAWLLVVLAAFSAGTLLSFAPGQEPKRKVQKWEYASGVYTAETMKAMGDQGWELVTAEFLAESSQSMLYFKRPK